MAYDEDETIQSRHVVETPTVRREVMKTEYSSEGKRSAMVASAALIILAVAVVMVLALLFWSMRLNSNNANLAAQEQPSPQTIVQQPPVIVQQPAPATQQAPIIVSPPAPASEKSAPSVPDDFGLQIAIDNKLKGDSILSTLDVSASVVNGKVLLLGKVETDRLKNQVERAVRGIKGVQSIDNKIIVGKQ